MPYKTPLRKKGVRETTFAHTVKLCWFHIKFEDIQNKITLKKFCEDFENIVINTGIWEKVVSEYNIDCDLHKPDGTLHKPNYDKLFRRTGWINLYEWKELYPKFKSDKLMSTVMFPYSLQLYIKHFSKIVLNDSPHFPQR